MAVWGGSFCLYNMGRLGEMDDLALGSLFTKVTAPPLFFLPLLSQAQRSWDSKSSRMVLRPPECPVLGPEMVGAYCH